MAKNTSDFTLAIIIPMFNEEKSAAKCIEAVIDVIRKQKVKTILILVNDGSSDKTELIIKEKQHVYRKYIRLVSYKQNKGYGKALQEGIKQADKQQCEYCLFMDSDLTNNPKFISDFIAEIPYDYDCVKASRFVRNGKMIGIPLNRRLFSLLGNVIARNLFRVNVRDCTNGFRMTRLQLLKKMPFNENDFSIILEELYYLKKMRARLKEIPTILTSRKSSTSHFTYTLGTLMNYFKYAIKALMLNIKLSHD